MDVLNIALAAALWVAILGLAQGCQALDRRRSRS